MWSCHWEIYRICLKTTFFLINLRIWCFISNKCLLRKYSYLLIFELIAFIPEYQFTARRSLHFIYWNSLRVLWNWSKNCQCFLALWLLKRKRRVSCYQEVSFQSLLLIKVNYTCSWSTKRYWINPMKWFIFVFYHQTPQHKMQFFCQ